MLLKIIFLISVISNIFVLVYFKSIAKIINIFDQPDNNRKLHTSPVALLGGFMIIFSLFFLSLSLFGTEDKLIKDFNINKLEFLTFFSASLTIFIMGIFDDKKGLNANVKLLLILFIVFLYLLFDKNTIIHELRFSFINNVIYLHSYSLPFTLLCFLLFINAFNMFDGIDMQCSFFSIFIFVILILFSEFTILSIYFLLQIIFFTYLNMKKKCFLGDNGTLVLSFILSALIIKSYNSSVSFLFADEIFLIMMLPGFELLRLALLRIYNKKHPFKADREHIHHYLLNNFTFLKTTLIIQSIIIVPFLINFYSKKTIIVIVTTLIVYSLVIYRFSKKKLN